MASQHQQKLSHLLFWIFIPPRKAVFWAEVPALRGCVTQGETVQEVETNLREAAEGWLSVETSQTEPRTGDRIVEVAVLSKLLVGLCIDIE